MSADKGQFFMKKVKYYLVSSGILPEVFSKVIEAKGYIASGEASTASQAALMAGISRSAYYKYKDSIFEYNGGDDELLTIRAKLKDNAGVLSALMNELYRAGANVLSVNQSVPLNAVADVSVTVRVTEMTVPVSELLENIRKIKGISYVKTAQEGNE